MQKCYRRLPLTGLFNARDLGGFPTGDGRITKYRSFIRCEAPLKLTDSDLSFLKEYNITTSIDFRGNREVERQPSLLKDVPWITYFRSPTFNEQVAFGSRRKSQGPPVTSFVDWGEKYIEMADGCKAWVRRTLEIISESDGAVMYNCTTGKDRTGMISALLLGLCGVSYEDITADYCVSELYLTPVYKELIRAYLEHWPEETAQITDPFFKTAPKNMQCLLTHFDDEYGGVAGYVAACGTDTNVIEAIRKKLII